MMDNYDLWLHHDAKCEAWLESLPVCDVCGQPIQDDYCFEINGNYICEDCLNDRHRVLVDDIMEQ